MSAGSEAHAPRGRDRPRAGHVARDPAAAEHLVAVVQHGRLAGRGGPDRVVGRDRPAALGRPAPRTVAGTGVARWRIRTSARNAPPGRGARRRTWRRSSSTVRRLEVLAPAERDRVGQRVDAADVARLAERDAEPLALADGVPGARRRARPPARRRRRPAARAPASSRRARAARRGSRRPARSRSPGSRACRRSRGRAPRATVADLGLGQLAEREPRVLELVLAQAVQEVGLVLVLVAGAQRAGRGRRRPTTRRA